MLRIAGVRISACLIACLFSTTTLFGAHLSFATAAVIAPVTTEGTISQMVFGPDGRASGVILQDRTFIKFSPESLLPSATLQVGDQVAATGDEVLSSPNKVLDRVVLRRGNIKILDNSVAQGPHAITPGARAGFKQMTDKSILSAVGARADGQIDSLVLQDGATVQVPRGAFVDPTKLRPGDQILVQGVGVTQPQTNAKFTKYIDAMNIQGPNGAGLLQARGEDGEKWIIKEAKTNQPLLTPRGEIDGVLLSDNTAIRFRPIPAGDAAPLAPRGTPVRAAGPALGNQLFTDTIVLSSSDILLDLGGPQIPPLTSSGMAGRAAGQMPEQITPAPGMLPMSDVSKVTAIFQNPSGKLDKMVLADGTTVTVPFHTRVGLPGEIKVGDRVVVRGRGGQYPFGSAIDADNIGIERTG